MIYKAYIALGTNLGNRVANLEATVGSIAELQSTSVVAVSKIYETDPVGYTEQGKFLNMVIAVLTSIEPLVLLNNLLNIENRLKRRREIHWGPRTIDIDILLYGDRKINLPELTIPHPRMLERAFVLVPLRDVYTDKMIHGENIDVLIDKCADKDGIRPYGQLIINN